MELIAMFVIGVITGAGIIAKMALVAFKKQDERQKASAAFRNSYYEE